MMYGHPPPPRASSSPTLILLASGLAGILGFLIGFLTGLGSAEPTTAAPYSPPEMTVTMESPTESAPGEGGPTAPVSSPPDASQPPATSPPATSPSTGQPPAGQPSAGQPSAGQPPAQPPSGGLSPGSGIQVVGTDIQPGTYRTDGPAPGMPMCYWARLKGTGGDPSEVITSGLPTGPATVTIETTDKAFQSGGCKPWARQ
ncbi:hypothetical protein [Nonomuraea africana]|uniref:Uncharacterized protein n=1 Tax=Nonomuraea africana TaxID=46171 RepID=A0ABR9KI55_9ACTN|nr:hypothetical protein [Nonomuraea africana]MBE1561252.1 hypothetical protein [Nonomuraea africana]